MFGRFDLGKAVGESLEEKVWNLIHDRTQYLSNGIAHFYELHVVV